MRKIGLAISVLAALAFPVIASGALSPTDYKNASAFCKALRAEMNTPTTPHAFQDTYGTNHNKRNAFGKCVSKNVHAVDEQHSNAAKDCKAEHGDTPESQAAFNDQYGTNKNKHNAFGNCVSQKAKAAAEALQEEIVNAAKQCRTERGNTEASREAFRVKYGTNHNKRNAFGKCVSKTVHENQANQS
jgi:hypothetical protein